jgi:hypothetical protein
MKATGRLNPLDRAEVEPAPKVVAYNAQSGGGFVLTEALMPFASTWARAGATFHTSHFSSCPGAAKHRKV